MPKDLDQVYTSGQFRILYSTRAGSPHAIPSHKDSNKNKIPDYVENVAIQANATTEAFGYLGYIHPLQNQRYKDQAHYIDIHIKGMDRNGLAFENPQYNAYLSKDKNQKCALSIALRHDLENFPGTWSLVSHELFHLYQYGYAQYKAPWYLEGMANWGERIIRRTVDRKHLTPLPSNQAEFKANVLQKPYNDLWHRLAYLAEKNGGKMPLPKKLLQRRYTDGSIVFRDDQLNGYIFMRHFFENLQARSNATSRSLKLNPADWPEKIQTSQDHSSVILAIIQQTMIEMGMNQTAEEKAFLKLK